MMSFRSQKQEGNDVSQKAKRSEQDQCVSRQAAKLAKDGKHPNSSSLLLSLRLGGFA
jgi:hypothetical protein